MTFLNNFVEPHHMDKILDIKTQHFSSSRPLFSSLSLHLHQRPTHEGESRPGAESRGPIWKSGMALSPSLDIPIFISHYLSQSFSLLSSKSVAAALRRIATTSKIHRESG